MLLLQLVLLDLGAHGSVEYDDPLLESLPQVRPQSVNVYTVKRVRESYRSRIDSWMMITSRVFNILQVF